MRYSTRHYAEALFESIEGKTGSTRVHALARFMSLLRRTGDVRHLNEILVRYEIVLLKSKGMLKVQVESAAPLSSSVKKDIAKALGKQVELIEIIDSKLLAGLRLLLNDTILIDATAQRRLEAFRT